MKSLKILFILTISILVIESCSVFSKTKKNAASGTATGGAVNITAGHIATNPALGTIAKATIGGSAGTIIGRYMDRQAEELKEAVPDATVERVGEGITVEFSSAVLFAVNKSDLSTEARGNLDKLVTVLNTYPDTNIEVQGHTDDTGTEAYNQTLSEKRATSVSGYLAEKGVDAARVTAKGYGELAPRYDNTTDEGRTRNRRVEFLITANEKMIADAEKEAAQ
jgi:outer membrane protein OmpA-like peptidoglycan-associated protein